MSKDYDECIRYCTTYRGSKLYILVGKKHIHINMENRDEFLTLAGLSLIESLINKLLEADWSLEEIAGICFENSYRLGDVSRSIHDAIGWYLDKRNEDVFKSS